MFKITRTTAIILTMTDSLFSSPAAFAFLPPRVDIDLATQNTGIDNHDAKVQVNVAAINQDAYNDARLKLVKTLC